MKLKNCLTGICLAALLAVVGCDQTDSTTATPANSGTGITGTKDGQDVTGPNRFSDNTPSSPGGAPSFGTPTGTGFSTGDAAHSGGQGGGLMGFGGTGANGTNGTITDTTSPPTDQNSGVKTSATESAK